MKKFLYLTLSLCSLFLTSQAQDADSTKGSFTFSGYLDTYYIANFNNPASRSNLGAGGIGTARAFDQRAGQFSLGLVQTKMVYSNRKSEAVVDLTFGPNADLGNYGNSFLFGSGSISAIAIKQAYFTYKATDKLSFTAGQFGTHIGYEVIDAPVNYNYSLSNLFNNGPFYHIGLKAAYAFSDNFALMAGVVNNVDNLNDNNRSKGVIAQMFVKPTEGWNVYINWMGSNEANPKANGKDTTASYSILDLTTTYQITDKFLIGVNAATGWQKGSFQGSDPVPSGTNWGGVAFYTNYAFTDAFGLGVRYEVFDNTGGARGLTAFNNQGQLVGAQVNSFTLTSNVTLADGHLLLKPELRINSYNKNKFDDADGNLKKSQTTLGLAAIYKF